MRRVLFHHHPFSWMPYSYIDIAIVIDNKEKNCDFYIIYKQFNTLQLRNDSEFTLNRRKTSNGRTRNCEIENENSNSNLFALLDDIGHQLFGLFGQFLDGFVGGRLMLEKVWANKSVVDDGRSVIRNWQHAPNEEDALKMKKKEKEIRIMGQIVGSTQLSIPIYLD